MRLIGFLVMFAIAAGGYMFFDFKMASRWASAEDADGLTVSEYLGGLSGRMAAFAASGSPSGLPTKLVDMLPKPPDGWTVRPAVAEDVAGFLPKSDKTADQAALDYVKAMALADQGQGVEAVALTYEKGNRKVLVKAARYPNVIFTSLDAMEQRTELQSKTAAFRGTEFMTVRGLDVTEDLLPDGFRGRYFLADVGAQIQVQVLVPKRTSDKELIPFFETLHVKAMNASVIDAQAGLGEVPVIVLASALDDGAREAYLSGVAERKAEKTSEREQARKAAEAQATDTAAAKTGGGFFGGLFGGSAEAAADKPVASAVTTIACDKGKDGVKRCKVDSTVEE